MPNDRLNSKGLKIALARVIAPYAFWSFERVNPSEVSDEKLIEAVLIHGNDPLRKRLLKLFNEDKIKDIWERKLIIQGSRLHKVNRKIAQDLLHIPNPQRYIQQAYKKHNLYDRFSA